MSFTRMATWPIPMMLFMAAFPVPAGPPALHCGRPRSRQQRSDLNLYGSGMDDRRGVSAVSTRRGQVAAMPNESDAASRHQIPVIDRMMEILDLLAGRSAGASISDLVEAIAVPRTTIYRILNTLQTHNVVRRSAVGSYTLGPR